jgi:hypothetical protein
MIMEAGRKWAGHERGMCGGRAGEDGFAWPGPLATGITYDARADVAGSRQLGIVLPRLLAGARPRPPAPGVSRL